MKKTILATLIAATTIGTTFANDISQQIFVANSSTHELAVLTPQEMLETEGAYTLMQISAISALGSMAHYTGVYYLDNGRLPNTANMAGAAATGAIGGIYGKIYGLARGLVMATPLHLINAGLD